MARFSIALILLCFLWVSPVSGEPNPGEPGPVGRILFTGDTMLARYIGEQIAVRDAPSYPFARIADYLDSFDTVITNLECSVSINGSNQGELYPFRAEPAVLDGLKEIGVTIANLANNHIFDYGERAARDTMELLRSHGITPVGAGHTRAEAVEAHIERYGTVDVAFLAFTDLFAAYNRYEGESFFIAPMQPTILREAIGRAREQADIVIVQLHWGWEYETDPRSSQRALAEMILDAGCDIIVGHHPHVVQDGGWSGDKYVAYSLGNFVFDQNFSPETSRGLVLEVSVYNDSRFEIAPREIAFGRGYQPYLLSNR